MKKKQINLSESKLHQIVRSTLNTALNEAYGTSSNSDIDKFYNLTHHIKPEDAIYRDGKDDKKYFDSEGSNFSELYDSFTKIWQSTLNPNDNIIVAIHSLAEKGLKMVNMYRNKLVGELGMDIDSKYERNVN